MFINVAAALHVFDISLPLDERGNVIKIVPKMSDDLIRCILDEPVRRLY